MFRNSDFVNAFLIHRHFDLTVKSSARPYYDNYFTSFSHIHLNVEPGFGRGIKLSNTFNTSVDKKLIPSDVIVPGNNFREIRLAKPQKERFPCEIKFLNNSILFTRLLQMPKSLKKL